ncbi:MAG TPA: hypothetical protein VGQ83_30365 [Polyangia bacterium]|jgi:hypothetical protein
MSRFIQSLLALSFGVWLVACGDSGNPPAQQQDAAVQNDAPLQQQDAAQQQDVAAQDDAAVQDGATDGAAPGPGDTCQTAVALTAPASLSDQTTVGYTNSYGEDTSAHGCGINNGLDRVYSITVPAGQRLTAAVTPVGAYDPAIYLIAGPASACDASPRTCLAFADDFSDASFKDTVRYVNRSAAAQTVFIVVDSYYADDTGGTFALDVTIDQPPAGDTCANADTVTVGTVDGTTVGFTNDYSGGSSAEGCTSSDEGPDHVYLATIPVGQRLSVTVGPDSAASTFLPSVYLIAGPATACDAYPRACLGAKSGATFDAPAVLRYTNSTGAIQNVLIVVDGSGAADAGAYKLTTALDSPPAGDTCGNAEATTAGNHTGQTTVGYSNDYSGGSSTHGCTYSDSGPDRVYSISVPDGQELTAAVTPEGTGFDPSIYLIAGPAATCGAAPRTCLAADNAGAATDTNTVKWANRSGSAQTVFIVVDSGSSSPNGGTFSLNVAVAAAPAVPTGETCTNAEVIAAAGTLTGQTTVGFTNDYDPSSTACAPYGAAGLDHVYSFSVPANQKLTVTLQPDAFDAVLYLIQGPAGSCTNAATCLAGADDGMSGGQEQVTWTNATAAAVTVFIVVDGYSSGSSGGYTLTTAVAAP